MLQVGDRNHKCQQHCMDPSDWRAMLRRHKYKIQGRVSLSEKHDVNISKSSVVLQPRSGCGALAKIFLFSSGCVNLLLTQHM